MEKMLRLRKEGHNRRVLLAVELLVVDQYFVRVIPLLHRRVRGPLRRPRRLLPIGRSIRTHQVVPTTQQALQIHRSHRRSRRCPQLLAVALAGTIQPTPPAVPEERNFRHLLLLQPDNHPHHHLPHHHHHHRPSISERIVEVDVPLLYLVLPSSNEFPFPESTDCLFLSFLLPLSLSLFPFQSTCSLQYAIVLY